MNSTSAVKEIQNGRKFEEEVLRVARAIWTHDQSGGAEFLDGRERDAVFYEEDVIHLVEMTIDRSESKAEKDCKKLVKLAAALRKSNPEKVVKCWFVTREEPTDRQRTISRNLGYPITVTGFAQFQSKIIDSALYLKCRNNHRFGSVSNPADPAADVSFVPIDVKHRSEPTAVGVGEICASLQAGQRICLTADYGCGKSMLLREVYRKLAREPLDRTSGKFPVHVNLREHSGAIYPDEILERHARLIGFSDTSKLVRAWRSGYVILILDGFDEITSLGIQGKWNKLKDLRFQGLRAVRELIAQQPKDAGVIVAGREYYFDSYNELRSCLGLHSPRELTLNEFTEGQVDSLLRSLGIASTSNAPSWISRKPLFVATLALRGYLSGLRGEQGTSVGEGWNYLISSICERESKISNTIDPETVRRILERVATIGRCKNSASALSQKDLTTAFFDTCAYEPDEQGLLLLERLPGLGLAAHGQDERRFVDVDFACALGAGDVSRFFVEPWSEHGPLKDTLEPLTQVGISVCKSILEHDSRSSTAQPALQRANGANCLRFDLLQVAIALGSKVDSNVFIQDLHIPFLEVYGDSETPNDTVYSDCIIDLLDVDVSSKRANSTQFRGCLIRSVSGVQTAGDIPQNMIDDRCVVENFNDAAETNAAILEGDLPLPLRVLLVMLRKLYQQAGAARKENAFYRGLDNNAQRYVADILDIMGSEGLANRERQSGETLIVPNRSEHQRISRILHSPATSADPLVIRVKKLG